MAESITYDIETIPQQATMTKTQLTAYKKLMYSQLAKAHPDFRTNKVPFSSVKKVRGLVMATNPYLCEIIAISLYKVTDTQEGLLNITGTEADILTRFWENLRDFKGTFVSFNGLEFDAPIIIKRSMKHRIEVTNNSFVDLKKFSSYPHFDVKMIFGNWDKYASGTLDLVCDFLCIASPKDGEVKASDVEQAFKEGRIQAIADYCGRDTYATYLCYRIAKDYVFKPSYKKY